MQIDSKLAEPALTTQEETRRPILVRFDWAIRLWSRFAKELVLLAGSGLALVVAIVQAGGVERYPFVGLDDSWLISLLATYRQGELLGRDIFFNYGPLSQLFAAGGASFNQQGTAYDALSLLTLTFSVLTIAVAALSLWLLRDLNWKYTLFALLLFNLFNLHITWFNYRSFLAVPGALLLAWALAAYSTRRQLVLVGVLGWWPVLMHLLTFEMGLYALGGAILTLLVYTVLSSLKVVTGLASAGRYLLLLAVFLANYVLGQLAVSAFFTLTSPNYQNFFDFQFYSLQIVQGYTYTMGSAWQLPWTGTLALGAMLLYCGWWIIRHLSQLKPAQGYLLVSLLSVALVQIKSSTIRSDDAHIAIGFLPTLFLFIILGYDWLGTRRPRPGWLALLVIILTIWPGSGLQTFKTLNDVAAGKESLTLRLQRFTTQNTPPEKVVATGLTGGVTPGKPLLVFPYENYLAIALRQPLVSPAVQAYAAHTEPLQQVYLRDLERHKANLEVIYGFDRLVSAPIDNVQHITRSPLIFEYLYRYFEAKTLKIYGNGFMVLRPRATPRSDMQSRPVEFTLQWEGSKRIYRFSQPANCTLLRLTPVITYPLYTLLGRPNALALSAWSGQEFIEATDLVAITPGQPFATYVSLVPFEKMSALWGSQAVPTRPVDTLHFVNKPSGFLGINASSFELSKLECLTFQR